MVKNNVSKIAFDESDINSHKERHVKLHNALDELFADYIQHHPDKIGFTNIPIIDLMKWSHEQTQDPTMQKER